MFLNHLYLKIEKLVAFLFSAFSTGLITVTKMRQITANNSAKKRTNWKRAE